MKTIIQLLCFVFFATQLHAQEKNISGTITDNTGLPLPGVNILIKGTINGTQSDFDGKYAIKAQVGQTIVYSYVGFKTAKKKIKSSSQVIDITLKEDAAVLEEVVVTGYSVKKTRTAVGYAVSSIKSESITSNENTKQNKSRNDISRLLAGKAAGVEITKASGLKGSSDKVIIRGISSLNTNTNPMYYINGVPLDINSAENYLQKLDPSEILSIEVLKESTAKELYGSKAKDGVVLINTVSENEAYARIQENIFKRVETSPLSTFSIDVDKAGYSNVRRMINNGQKVPQDAVKIEEMVNYFNYQYNEPTGKHPFSINTELALSPWNKNAKLVRIGIKGKNIDKDKVPASNLVFLLDVSGSMESPNKLPLLKSSLHVLVNQLRKKDKVSIVVYAGAAGLVLKPTSGNKKQEILEAIEKLSAGGSTAGGEGIELAYKIAEENFIKRGNNRIVLATDGDFNVGASSDLSMEDLIVEKRKSGVFLTVLGFGMNNYKDSKMETLADKGNGNHAYIDTKQEAQKVLGEEFFGTMYTIAKDVKIQVEFNPNKVQAYRLIGYENRLLNDEDFIDDKKDAGELGSGHTVTALYEIVPVGVNSVYVKNIDSLKYTKQIVGNNSDEILTVKFRYKEPSGKKSKLITSVMKDSDDKIENASDDFKFSAAVALFGMQLRKSIFMNTFKKSDVIALAKSGKGEDKDGYRAEFIRLVKSYN
ncbi:MAG: von Willebrand factor type A domain-containing protein [Flavobacteriaceae bacterium]|nr:von Willebrand factor type A domain-containing protein [Flavobacteriaceae bacterium]